MAAQGSLRCLFLRKGVDASAEHRDAKVRRAITSKTRRMVNRLSQRYRRLKRWQFLKPPKTWSIALETSYCMVWGACLSTAKGVQLKQIESVKPLLAFVCIGMPACKATSI